MTRLPVLMLLIAACSDYPRDTAGTLERVRGGEIRAGWVGTEGHEAALTALARQLATDANAGVRFERGAAEPLLARLEAGELDLVLGGFDRKTPWSKRVTFSQPVAGKGEPIEAKAALRSGEHRWAMAVDRAANRVTGAGR